MAEETEGRQIGEGLERGVLKAQEGSSGGGGGVSCGPLLSRSPMEALSDVGINPYKSQRNQPNTKTLAIFYPCVWIE